MPLREEPVTCASCWREAEMEQAALGRPHLLDVLLDIASERLKRSEPAA